MQRISEGMAVPKQQLDMFSGKVTGTGARTGEVDCELLYLPKGIEYILTPSVHSVGGFVLPVDVIGLVGKTVTLKVYIYVYYKTISAANAIGACDGSGGGPSHGSHALSHSYWACGLAAYDNEALDPIRINYTVA